MVSRRNFGYFVRLIATAASSAAVLMAATPVSAQPKPTLRVCADPDNLPFSSNAEGKDRGMYVEVAELVGRKLDLPLEITWWHTTNQRRAMRNTIQKDECDAMFALPANTDWRARGVQKSNPFLDVGYAIVAAPGVSITSLESLKGKRIALQFSSTPHLVFSNLVGYTTSTHRTPDEIFQALTAGQADVGILWGPVAGYDNKHKYQGRWQLTPLSGMDMSGQVVVGVRAGAEGLKARIDQALADLQPEIKALADKYGFPTGKAIALEASKPNSLSTLRPTVVSRLAVPSSGWQSIADAPADKSKAKPKATSDKTKAAAVPAAAATATTTAAAAATPTDPLVGAGRMRFNDQCSHCHGTDGASPIRERDVRRLSMRYDADKWQTLALTTIKNGRNDQGMPAWKDVLSEQQLKELLAFINTIQK